MSLARELLLARIAAYRQQNFAYIYDSAHPDSFFRQQFPERDEYLAFAAEQLADRIQINSFEILREELSDNQARIIFYQQLQIGTNLQETVECGRLILEDGVWLYHSSQKLLLDEFAGDLKQITFADFDQAQDKIVF
ncbi:MAG TPA: YchJ family metal-binding protein [Geothermobacteraceae bacterium]|nr:YchJ family metal-binding protein [Geothermobacteraceae bacterium]